MEWWDSEHSLRIHAEISGCRPLHVGASETLMLAFASDEIRRQLLSGRLAGYTNNTILAPDELEE